MSQQPIACDLSAIPSDELNDHKKNGEGILNSVTELLELPDGYALRLPAEKDLIAQAGAFISRERLCCPFFNFTLEVAPNHGPVWLKLTGDKNVKQYISDTVVPHLELE